MEFIKKVVEEALRRAENHLIILNQHCEQIDLELKNNRAQAAQTEKHIAEMKKYLQQKDAGQVGTYKPFGETK